jgi:hypothetical protein
MRCLLQHGNGWSAGGDRIGLASLPGCYDTASVTNIHRLRED